MENTDVVFIEKNEQKIISLEQETDTRKQIMKVYLENNQYTFTSTEIDEYGDGIPRSSICINKKQFERFIELLERLNPRATVKTGKIKPFKLHDPVNDTQLEIKVSEFYTTIIINNREYYFNANNGCFDGTGQSCIKTD